MDKQPLADKLRPKTFDDMVGQSALVGKNGTLRRMMESGFQPNMIFFGPAGTGKTTAANIIAAASEKKLYKLNATTASLSDIKEIISETDSMFGMGGILLYLDEIQYFNKKQQQSLLEFMEDGRITLIASTTENPYFYVYGAVLSRSSVFEFHTVSAGEMQPLLRRGLALLNADNQRQVACCDEVLFGIAGAGAGDVRRALGVLEACFYAAEEEITAQLASEIAPSGMSAFDKDGDSHYNLLSALQKSIRGSDPDAAIFYLAKLLEGGDLFSACRRLQVIASEDIGLAYPMAASVVQSCVASARDLGLPEARIPLSHATILLATAPKSNSANAAYEAAAADVNNGRGGEVPSHLRDAHYGGASKLGHGLDYQYPHAYPNHYVPQQYLPDDLKDSIYYHWGENKTEQAAKAYADKIKKEVKQ